MLELLQLNNFHSGFKSPIDVPKEVFVLKTCQRTLFLSLGSTHLDKCLNATDEILSGVDAYVYLLEIICGMKSRLLGENEIVAQFKSSYKEYIKHPKRCNKLLLILEKLFQDAKKIRTQYLLGLSQKTYGSIARKSINRHRPKSVLILGSGQLALDLINQFKKTTKVFISARNDEKVQKILDNHEVNITSWKDFREYSNFPFIVNSIGCDNKFILNDFFTTWSTHHANKEKLFIDLGSPSVIETPLTLDEGVMRLDDVFNEGAILEQNKMTQVDKAKQAMVELSKQRNYVLQRKIIKTQ